MPGQPSMIKRILDERGIRYGHFAGKVGIPAYTFTRIEEGKAQAPSDYYERAAEYLQVPVELLRPAPQPVEVA